MQNWELYGGGTIDWIGVHNFFDDEAFAQPFTRTHPVYGSAPMTYPGGAVATGYAGDPADPRNSRVYDAGCAKNILGHQASWLNQYPQYRVAIEGHADDAASEVGKLLHQRARRPQQEDLSTP